MEHTGEEDGDKDDVLLVLMFACTGQMYSRSKNCPNVWLLCKD